MAGPYLAENAPAFNRDQKPLLASGVGHADDRTEDAQNTEKEWKKELNQIREIIVDAAFHARRALGPGLLESVYEIVLADALWPRALKVERP